MSLTRSSLTRSVPRSVLWVAAFAVAAVLGDVAPAQDTKQKAPAARSEQTAVNDEEIKAFAAAVREIDELVEAWTPKVAAAQEKGPAEARQTKQQAMAEMVEAVQRNGLSVDKYNEITDLAESDPEVQRKIVAQLKQDQKNKAPK